MEPFFHELWNARAALLDGLLVTIEVSVIAITLGTVLGIIIGLGLVYGQAVIRILCRLYVDILRSTPILVLLFASFYILPTVLPVSVGAFEAGTIALVLFCASHVAELLRGSLQIIPRGQVEAGLSIGLTFRQVLANILLPQAVRSALPPWINTATELVKASTLLSVIGLGELLLRTQEIVSRNFMTLHFYVLAGLVYLLVNLAIERFGKHVERRLSVH